MLAFTNIFSTIWSFLETVYTFMVKVFSTVISTITLTAAPFRMFLHAIGSFASVPVYEIFLVIITFSVVLTVYRIFRGNI